MNPPLRLLPALVLALALPHSARAADDTFVAPDSLLLKDGRTVHGLIVKNTWNSVVLQEKMDEVTYPKSQIVRIRDAADTDAMFTGVMRKGALPSWRVIANDLRTLDVIKSLVEIPATAITTGEFKNIPYISFRVNQNGEMNIYGDPQSPAAFEIGIHGSASNNKKFRQAIRGFLAGFLATRDEIAALYAIDLNGGIKTAGDLTLEITPRTAPDAEGAWWISLYNKASLARIRLTDAQYAKITRPLSEVVDKRGRVIANGWSAKEAGMSSRLEAAGPNGNVILRGFYRDKDGQFRLVTESANTGTN
jgi:hypothetical protein